MIDVIFNQNNNDTFLELRVKSFDLILSIDFVDKLKNFFDIPESQSVEDEMKDVANFKAVSTTSAAPSQTKGNI